ncbi:MAG: hypothetical protein ACOX1H_03010 [Pseudoramibacter sp.]
MGYVVHRGPDRRCSTRCCWHADHAMYADQGPLPQKAPDRPEGLSRRMLRYGLDGITMQASLNAEQSHE